MNLSKLETLSLIGGAGRGLKDEMDEVAEHGKRYRIERASGRVARWIGRYAVKAGTGTRSLYEGSKYECMVFAAELQTAFYDGVYVGAKTLSDMIE